MRSAIAETAAEIEPFTHRAFDKATAILARGALQAQATLAVPKTHSNGDIHASLCLYLAQAGERRAWSAVRC